MKLRYIHFQPQLMGLLVATFLSGTIVSGLKAQDASIATTRPQVVVDAASQGIVGDGATLNTPAIQSAIDSLSSHGGGVLEFPAGRYVTGTIQLKDNVRLRLSPDAILLGSHNPADYRILEPFLTGDGGNMGYALVTAVDASHVGIEGSGTIDGQGKSLKAAQAKFTIRPFLIRWVRCTEFVVRDVHLTNPGAWTMHFFQCKNVVGENLTIRSADSHLTNNDGIDIDSCQGARVSNCDIESGDDAICVKTTSPKTSGDLTITDCTLKTRCNGIKLGTESIGDFANIRVSNCKLHDLGMSGIALYAVDGAQLHDVTLTDLDMDGVTVPISIRLGARLKTFHPGDQARSVGTLHDITIENINATGAKQIGLLINGIPDHPVESLRLRNIDITLNGGGQSTDANVQLAEKEKAYPEYNMFGKVMPAYGAYIRHARGITSEHVNLSTTRPDARPGVDLIDAEGVNAGDFSVATPAA